MKTFYILCSFVVLLLISCNKEENFIEIPAEDTKSNSEISKPIYDLVDLSSNMAKFRSEEDLKSFMNLYLNLDETQENEFLNTVSYTTLTAYLDSLYDQLDLIEDRDTFIAFVNSHSDYLEIITDENDEEEVVEKEIPSNLLNELLNSDGIIQVGEEYYKYISNLYVVDNNYNALVRLKSKQDVLNSKFKYEEAYTVLGEESDSRWNDMDNWDRRQRTYDESGCNGDRRAIIRWRLHDEKQFGLGTFGGYPHWRTVYINTEIIAKRKGRPCIWYKYNTNITRNNWRFEGKIRIAGEDDFNYAKVLSNYQYYGKELKNNIFILNYTANSSSEKADGMHTRERCHITTTGLNGLWLLLDQ